MNVYRHNPATGVPAVSARTTMPASSFGSVEIIDGIYEPSEPIALTSAWLDIDTRLGNLTTRRRLFVTPGNTAAVGSAFPASTINMSVFKGARANSYLVPTWGNYFLTLRWKDDDGDVVADLAAGMIQAKCDAPSTFLHGIYSIESCSMRDVRFE